MTKTISLKNITQQFSERTIIENVSFICRTGKHLCIVGDNGVGKSTILQIIAGTLIPTKGTISTNGYSRQTYVAQEFPGDFLNSIVEEYISHHTTSAEYKKLFSIAKELGYDVEKVLSKKCLELSGGQQKILMLSCALAITPDFLLLDEPENHLDIVSRRVLITLLSSYEGGLLFISHDRALIDSLADSVIEVADKSIHISKGDYQDYLDSRSNRIASTQRNFDIASKRIKQLEAMMPILQQKAFRGKDVATYLKRKNELQEMKDVQKAIPRAKDRHTTINLNQSGSDIHMGKLLCRVESLTTSYSNSNRSILRDVSLELRTGEPVVILGRNGSGKSTFLKCLMGKIPLTSGSITWEENIHVTHFDQHVEFNESMSALEIIQELLPVPTEKARSLLGAMKLSAEKIVVPIAVLSGGERMRLRFAIVFGGQPDCIILDEPTNHLDETTWEIVLRACNETKATIILVTHDHEFIDGLESKLFWLLKDQSIKEQHKDLEEIILELQG